jgi:PAS domain S-box-containing protein
MKTPLRILIFEDVETEVELIEQELCRTKIAFTSKQVTKGEDFIKEVKRFSPDLILSDYLFPSLPGIDSVILAREHAPNIPLIIVTVSANEETVVKSRNEGAADVITKEHLIRLGPAILQAQPKGLAIDEKEEQEVSLEQNEEIFRLISENVSDLIAVLDTEGKRIYNSPSYTSILGDPGKLQGTDSFTEIHPEDRDRVRNIFKETVKTGFGQNTEYRLLDKDGNIRYVNSQGNVILDRHGKTEKVIVISRDVTRSKQAEEILRENEQKYSNLFQYSNDGILLHDLDGNIIDINQKALDQFGFSKEEILSLTMSDLHPPEALEFSKYVFERISQNRFFSFRVNFRRKNGEVFPADVSASLFELAGRKVVQKIVRDITVRKRVEEALRGSEEHFRTLIQNSSDIIMVLEKNGSIRYVSPSVQHILGYRQQEITGKNVVNFVHPEDQPRITEIFNQEVQHSEKVGRIELRVAHSNNSWHYFESVSNNLLTDTSVGAIVINARDITERKQAEEELSSSKRFIERIARAAPNFIYVIDIINEKYLYVNDLYEKALGYPKERILAEDGYSFIQSKLHPDDLAQVMEKQRLIIEKLNSQPELIYQDKVHEFEYRVLDANNNWRWIHSWGVVFETTEDAKISQVLGIAYDITDRKSAEKEISMHHHALRNISEGVCITDMEDNFVFVNDAFLKMYGYSEGELIGQSVSMIRSQTNPSEVVEEIRDSTLRGGWRGELWNRKKDGSEFMISLSTSIVPDESGQPIALMAVARDITESKRAEDALRESEIKYRSLFNKIADPILIFERETNRFLDCNESVLRNYGYSIDELKNMTPFDLHPAEDLAKVKHNINIKNVDTPFSYTHVTKNGRAIDVEILSDEIEYQGRPAWISIARDVTERKQAEDLQAAVYRIAQAADRASGLDDLYRAVHEIIQQVMPANNFYIALYDEREDLIHFPYFVDEFDVPSPPQKPGKGLTEYVLRTGKSLLCTREVHEELQDREEAELVGVPSPIWLGVPLVIENKTIGVMTVQHYTDAEAYGQREQHILEFVSSQVAKAIDHKRAEEALQVSEERYRRFFMEDVAGNYISTPGGKLRACNAAFLRIFGFKSMEEAAKIDFKTLYAESHKREEFLEGLRKNKKLIHRESELRKQDGTPVHVIENAIGSFDSNGNLVEIRGYLLDTTEQKKLEEQLLHAQKMEAVGELASGIAHDFNNILSVALGGVHLIQTHSSDPQIERFARMIEDATLRGSAIAKQLLQFSHAEASSLEPISLTQIVMEAKKLIDHSFSRSISVELEINVKQGVIMGDAGQIHQVLLNLCINARDAILERPEGVTGAKLTLAIEEAPAQSVRDRFGEATADHYVVIRISDNGIGISMDVRRRMFDPFFTTKEIGQGTGLGLSVVHGIVKSHHGFIDVKSQVGKGTDFSIYFPSVTHELVEEKSKSPLPMKGGDETILVIEDEEALRDLVKETLTRAGYTVIEAKDGEEALAIYRETQQSVSLVLSDIGLPKMSGEQVVKGLKQINREVKVIISTGFIREDKKAELVKEGALSVIHKPYSSREMLRSIREVLDKEA